MDLYRLDSNYLPASEWIRQTIQRLGTKDDVIEFFLLKNTLLSETFIRWYIINFSLKFNELEK